MAKTDLDQLVVKMSADLSRFEKSMLKAQGVSNQAAGRIQKRFNDMNKGLAGSFGNLGTALKGAFAALSIEKVVTTVIDLVKSVADIGDAADKLGVSTDEFQQMGFAAKLAGVETDRLVQGMKKLALNSSEASRGQGDLGKIFAANGVSIRDANGQLLSQTQILALVAELIRNAANEQDQAAIAQAAFGKSGIDLLNLLTQGAAGVTRAMQQAKDAGVTFSEEQIRQAQRIDDAFDTLQAKISTSLKSSFLDFAETSIREWDAITSAIDVSSSALATWITGIESALNASERLNQSVAGGKVDREVPKTPGALGKGDLPANIGSGFQLVRPTVIPLPRTSTPAAARTPRAAGHDEYQRSTQQIQENIKLLQAERDAILANVTATDGYDAAVEKARITEQLMNDARAAGIKITPELKANIDQLAGAYASMQAQTDAARAKHDEFVKSLEETKALTKDVLGGFITDLRNGESALDALGNALDKIIDSLLDMAINNLVENAFKTSGSGSGGGLLSGLFGGLFGGGGGFAGLYAKGGTIPSGKWGIAGEAGPEIIRGPASVTPIGRASAGGRTQITIVQNISANGDRTVADIAYQQTSRALREYDRKRPSIDVERRLRAQ